jgi:hypothetical protein
MDAAYPRFSGSDHLLGHSLAAVNLSPHRFHGERNYTIAPKTLSLER